MVSKQEVLEEVEQNVDAQIYFGLVLKSLRSDLGEFETKRKGVLSYTEFGVFLREQKIIS